MTDNTCVVGSAISDCAEHTSLTVCARCDPLFYPSSNTCAAIDENNASTCTDSDGIANACTECPNGYTLTAGHCEFTVSGCDTVDGDGVCTNCATGELNGAATCAGTIANCETESGGNCTQCMDTYMCANAACDSCTQTNAVTGCLV